MLRNEKSKIVIELLLDRKGLPAPNDSTQSVAKNSSYIPDYSVRAISDLLYLKIDKTTYQRARKTSIMKRPLQVYFPPILDYWVQSNELLDAYFSAIL